MSQINKLLSKLTGYGAISPRDKENAYIFAPNYVMPRPFRALPNVSKLWVRPNIEDPLLSRHGLSKKFSPEMDFEEYSWRIKAANRYLSIMQFRLEKLLRSNRIGHFWYLALMLMQRSVVLKAVALRKLNKNWHREFKFGFVKQLLKRLSNSIEMLNVDLKIIRQYEDKVLPDGSLSHRPVGNPSYVDRMYTYMLQSFLVMYLEGYISDSQHAYRPGKGVVTALKEVESAFAGGEYRYAWEFDLKGAFPSVNIMEVFKALNEVGMPKEVCEFLERMCTRTVERVDMLPEDQKGLLPEPKFEKQELLAPALDVIMPSYEGGFRPILTPDRLTELFLYLQGGTTRYGDNPDMFPYEWKTPDEMQFRDMLYMAYNRRQTDDSKILWSIPDKPRPWPLPNGAIAVRISNEKGAPFPGWKIIKETPTVSSPTAADNRELHAKMLGASNKIAVEIQGFPQGLGISPVLFNFAFEYSALRRHFMALFSDFKIISYADDFLLLSKKALGDVFQSSPILEKFGLVFNLKKSRILLEDGVWKVDNFKYLGVRFHATPQGLVSVEGASRHNPSLPFDKEAMNEAFDRRESRLREIIARFEPDSTLSPKNVLDLWGQGVAPWKYLPLGFISGDRDILEREIQAIEHYHGESQAVPDVLSKIVDDVTDLDSIKFSEAPNDLRDTPLRRAVLAWAETQGDYVFNALDRMTTRSLLRERFLRVFEGSPGNLTASAQSLVQRFKSGIKLNAFGNRLAGLLINRLHSGEWSSVVTPADRSLKSPVKTQGRSWIELLQNLRVRTPRLMKYDMSLFNSVARRLEAKQRGVREMSIYNSTSMATKDLLQLQKFPNYVKITGKGLRYR